MCRWKVCLILRGRDINFLRCLLILVTRTTLVVLRRGENGKGALTTLYKYPRSGSKIDLNARHILLPPIQLSGGFELKLQNFTLGFLPFRRIIKRNVTLIRFIEISPFPPSTRCFRNTKKLFLVPQASWKIHVLSTEGQTFYWSIYKSWWQQVSVRALRLGKWVVFIIAGLSASVSLPFFPTPSPLLYSRHFLRGLRLFSSETARKRLLRRLSGQRTFSTERWGLKIQQRDGNENLA